MIRRNSIKTALLALGCVYAVTAAGVATTEESAESAGKKIFLKFKCNSCHTLQAAAIGKGKAEEGETQSASKRKPPDLSGIGKERNAAWIEGFVLKTEMIEGRRHTKKFRGGKPELKTLAVWLETFKTEAKKDEGK